MRRAEFLKLVDLSSEALKSLIRRKHVRLANEAEGRGWGEYTAEDALLTRLSLELSDDGLSQRVAAGIVEEKASELAAACDRLNDESLEHLYFGLIRERTHAPADSTVPEAETDVPLVGTFGDLQQAYQMRSESLMAAPADQLGLVRRARGIRLVDVSLIAYEIRERAKLAGLPRPTFWKRRKGGKGS